MTIEKQKLRLAGIGLLVLALAGGRSYASARRQESPQLPSVLSQGREGRFEIGIHFSLWTLDLLRSAIEGEISDELGQEIRDEITDELGGSQAGLIQAGYEQNLALDTGGHNFGIELRYYPRGRDGDFSLGFAVDKARMRLQVDGSLIQSYTDGTSASATAYGEILVNPVFTSLSFRWDFLPRSILTPFVNLGVGIAALDGELNYEYSGEYARVGYSQTIGESEQQTIKEAEEDMDVNLPNVLPLLQLHLGIRAELLPNLNIRAEAGIWDGFQLRFGLSGRF